MSVITLQWLHYIIYKTISSGLSKKKLQGPLCQTAMTNIHYCGVS